MSGKESTESGILYLAFGYDYLVQAVLSFISVRQHHPEIPISIITNIDISEKNPGGIFEDHLYFDEIIYVDVANEDNRQYKTSLIEYTPYKKTLFLDSDTIVQKKIDTGYYYLDEFDFAALPLGRPLSSNHHHLEGAEVHLEGLNPNEVTYWNTGVLFFNKNKQTMKFFERWNENYNKISCSYDAISFLNTVCDTGISIYPLTRVWNASKQQLFYESVDERLRIHHYYDPIRDGEVLSDIIYTEKNLPSEFCPSVSHQRDVFRNTYNHKQYILYKSKQNLICNVNRGKRLVSKIFNWKSSPKQ